MANIPSSEIYFGGPGFPAGRLRDVLAERVAAIPDGGSIDWVSYYFRDRRLAEELLRACRRGVKITLTLEGRPRTPTANEAVVAMLAGPDDLGKGFRSLSLPGIPTLSGKRWKPHLHEKLYCFSHPQPVAFIGSFNPSGDGSADKSEVIREIGDQDRGHNVLVGIRDPLLVNGLVAHARWIHQTPPGMFWRFSPPANRVLRGKDTEIHFWPRVRPHPVSRFLRRVGKDARIRIAASHIKGRAIVKAMIRLTRCGAKLEILAEPTLRRVPSSVEKQLREAGIPFRRVTHPQGLPMHNKFVLVEQGHQRWVVFGSFNWTTRSFWLNQEIVAISTNERLFDAFAERWEVLQMQRG